MTPLRRDLRIDSLRGLLLVCMAINHVTSDFHWITDRPLGLFSAAEGFVFVSGLLAGIVYTRRLREQGPGALRAMTTRRATAIYGWHVAAYIACLVAVQAADAWTGRCSLAMPRLFHGEPGLALLLGAAMLHQPGWLDILPMYCAFVLLLRWILPALENGHHGRVLGVSFLVWLAIQWAPPIDGAPLAPVHFGSFNLLAWQFLFVLGVTIGHQRTTETRPLVRPRPWLIAGALAITVYAWGIHHCRWPQPWSDRLFGVMLNKPALGALRLGDFLLIAYLVALIGSAWPRALTWRPLAFLGRHSLVVVAVQSVAVLALMQFPALFRDPPRRAATNGALLAILFLAATGAELWKTRASWGPKLRPRLRPPTFANQAHVIRPS